jgi:hypothetical protein
MDMILSLSPLKESRPFAFLLCLVCAFSTSKLKPA